MWRTRALEAGVGVAALLSIGLLALMLAAPWLPQRTASTLPVPTVQPTPVSSSEAGVPPIGLYLLRGPFSFGPCLALELTPRSYPVAADAEGTATVLTWQRGMTGCDARSGEVDELAASVTAVMSEAAEARVVGYAVRFRLSLGGAVATAVEITILANQSTAVLLQALETSTQGSPGLVFDRVPSVDPTLDPLPSETPAPTGTGPTGLFLLAGPFDGDNPCLALELTADSYPADSENEGTARMLWWERGGTDLADPAVCLTRRGEVEETPATLTLVTDSTGTPLSYELRFAVPLAGSVASEEVVIGLMLENRIPEQLQGVMVMPAGTDELTFDRVDELDPPLAPAPSGP